VVDLRDSVLGIFSSDEQTAFRDREKKVVEIVASLTRGCLHLLQGNEEDANKVLHCLSPMGVVVHPDQSIVLAHHPILNPVTEEGYDFSNNTVRWKAPEILAREVTEENEKSCAFTISLTCFSLLSNSLPFSSVPSDQAASLIMKGERPPLDSLRDDKCRILIDIEFGWEQSPTDRYSLEEMKAEMEESLKREVTDVDAEEDETFSADFGEDEEGEVDFESKEDDLAEAIKKYDSLFVA
jgi:hypothetical protein